MCGLCFDSRYKLAKHRKLVGHQVSRAHKKASAQAGENTHAYLKTVEAFLSDNCNRDTMVDMFDGQDNECEEDGYTCIGGSGDDGEQDGDDEQNRDDGEQDGGDDGDEDGDDGKQDEKMDSDSEEEDETSDDDDIPCVVCKKHERAEETINWIQCTVSVLGE